MGYRHKARITAFQGIFSWELNNNPVDFIADFEWLEEENKVPEIVNFAALLLAGTLENIEDIDSIIKSNIDNWDLDRISKVDLAILRMSVYSLKYQNDVPSTVTIDEAVTLAKEFGAEESYRFINGVLDGIKNKLNL